MGRKFTGVGDFTINGQDLDVDGVTNFEGEINVDRIEADGCISAKEIYGDRICIHSVADGVHGIVRNLRGLLRSIGSSIHSSLDDSELEKFKKMQNSQIGTLEATVIELEYTSVQQLAGNDITIGEGCYVENVDCDGILRISNGAVVKNISGKHDYHTID